MFSCDYSKMRVETSVFVLHVQKHVETVMKSEPIGLCQKLITFMNPKPSCPDYIVDAKCDRFKMVIPYAGVPVECLVIFQATLPSCPPDFLFADSRFIVPLDKINALDNWNVHNSSGLLEVVKQLMHHFKIKHFSLLENYYAIHQEYMSVVSRGIYSEEDIEVFVPSNKHIPISILIRLKPDFHRIPPIHFKISNIRNYPLLLLTFFSHDKNKRNQKLFFSSELELTLGLAVNFKLSSYSSNVPLGQYVSTIEGELTKKAEAIANSYELRKQYVATFLSHLEHCIVEYDSLLFKKLSFIVEEEDYHILVEINIPSIYPVTMPLLRLRSLYHAFEGVPTSVPMNSYPFSPDWSLDHIYEQTIKYINDYASLFPQESLP